MLFLVFELDGHRYALDSSQLIEVLPMVNLTPLSHMPPAIAGMFDYHGRPVPAIDLSEIIAGRSARRRLNTRMVVVSYPADDAQHTLGLIAEKATGTLRLDAAQFRESGVSNEDAPYLGPVARDTHGLIQWLGVTQLLPLPLRNMLFQS
jgi:chemotaxis-related protein WspB